MNPVIGAPQLQPHRPSTSCDRHPDEHFTGFCASCLCERLAVLDQSAASASSTSRRTHFPASNAAASALRAIFKPSTSISRPAAFSSELRRTKSFSASKNEKFSVLVEPQRKSCDVRVRSTLWSLFNKDTERNFPARDSVVEIEARGSSSSIRNPVLEDNEEEVEEVDAESQIDEGHGEILNALEQDPNLEARHLSANQIGEIVEEEGEVVETRKMKDGIDLDLQNKKNSGRDLKEIAGSFWTAASVFSKRLQKWRQRQKEKKRRNGGAGSETVQEGRKPTIRRLDRETQSEVADYMFGRRSCDTDPRFSIDASRLSFDDPRHSIDEPRASWDGYLMGRSYPRMPTMVSVVEDSPVNHVSRTDMQILVDEAPAATTAKNSTQEDDNTPGGSAQTRDYYSDSSSRRRKSIDRSNSIRKTAAAVTADIDEFKSTSNTKLSVSPASLPCGKQSHSLSHGISFKDDGSDRKAVKKYRVWSKAWSIWGFMNRRSTTTNNNNNNNNNNKDDDGGRDGRSIGVERSLSESWQVLGKARNGEVTVREGLNRKLMRSNSSVSWRNSQNHHGRSFGSGKKTKKDEFVVEKNRGARYSPNSTDHNGLLRFYWTPMRRSRRNPWGKSNSGGHTQAIPSDVYGLY